MMHRKQKDNTVNNDDNLTKHELGKLTIQFMNCIKGIPPIIKLDKCISRWSASNPDTVLQKTIIKASDYEPIMMEQIMKNV